MLLCLHVRVQQKIFQFLDHWLQPIMRNLPSYLKDTSQLINELRWLSIEPNTILVTIDVKSLYTCIPHPERIQACTEALQKAKESNPSQPDTAVIGCLLEIVLRVMFLSLMTHITNHYMGLLWARS